MCFGFHRRDYCWSNTRTLVGRDGRDGVDVLQHGSQTQSEESVECDRRSRAKVLCQCGDAVLKCCVNVVMPDIGSCWSCFVQVVWVAVLNIFVFSESRT